MNTRFQMLKRIQKGVFLVKFWKVAAAGTKDELKNRKTDEFFEFLLNLFHFYSMNHVYETHERVNV